MFIAKYKDLVILANESKEELLSELKYTLYDTIEEVDSIYENIAGVFMTKEEQSKMEEDCVNQLTMTPLDFINVLINKGITDDEIDTYLNEHKELKRQLTYCQNVYCGIACKAMPITINGKKVTKKDIITAFKQKHGMAM